LGEKILEERPGTKVVALTALEDERTVKEALRMGFHGYVSKNTEGRQFRRVLESVFEGQMVFPERQARSVDRGNGGGSHAELLAKQLTPREVQVLELLAEGASSAEIARRLTVSPNTVRTHVQGILSKLQVHSRLEAAAFAVRHGVVTVHR
jgi:two-component system nitrate/nitrite response regulator NarL